MIQIYQKDLINMKIKKFRESNNIDISVDRVKEIIEKISEISSDFDSKKDVINGLKAELSNYKSSSSKSNDQIDDSVSNLQIVNSKIEESMQSIETIIKNLENYVDNGRKYLY